MPLFKIHYLSYIVRICYACLLEMAVVCITDDNLQNRWPNKILLNWTGNFMYCLMYQYIYLVVFSHMWKKVVFTSHVKMGLWNYFYCYSLASIGVCHKYIHTEINVSDCSQLSLINKQLGWCISVLWFACLSRTRCHIKTGEKFHEVSN